MEKRMEWVGVNLDFTKELIWLSTTYPKAQAVLYFLIRNMDEHNSVKCSYKELEDYFSLSRSTMHRAIRVLEKRDLIQIVKAGVSNVYVVSPNLAWAHSS
jgi:Fe2+ or Zn2+ uptake regulation protein